jgi:hypothetical protein
LGSGPAEALPQQTLTASYKLQANDETHSLQHFRPGSYGHGHLRSPSEGPSRAAKTDTTSVKSENALSM